MTFVLCPHENLVLHTADSRGKNKMMKSTLVPSQYWTSPFQEQKHMTS